MSRTHAGQKFKQALQEEQPLQIVGVINAYTALMAEKAGFRCLYLSGAGVANFCYGLPDIGLTTSDQVIREASRITMASSLPLLVDIDTGWGGGRAASRAVKALERAGVGAIHIEDQFFDKRCGHLDGKKLVSIQEMCDRIKACLDGREDPDFVVMARTDAFASEGIEGVFERLSAYREAGADCFFPEALPDLSFYKSLQDKGISPLLCNLTEFGKTTLFSKEMLQHAGIAMALYPLSGARAMNLAAIKTFETIRKEGSQRDCLEEMQTREELYYFLNYNPD